MIPLMKSIQPVSKQASTQKRQPISYWQLLSLFGEGWGQG